MEDNVFLGETILTESKEFLWIKNISAEEYVDIETIDIGEANTISIKKRIAFFKYFINYLLLKNYEAFGLEKRKVSKLAQELVDKIEAGEEVAEIDKLADLIIENFKDRNFAPDPLADEVYGTLATDPADREIWTKEDIKAHLRADIISREAMIVYGFGLGMDIDELETFLMKVLEETGLNIWDRKEGLQFIAFSHFPNESIDFYIRADELYDDHIYVDKRVVASKNLNLNTVDLQNYLDEYLNTFDDIDHLDDDTISDIINYHKELVSQNTGRTITAEFTTALENIEETLESQAVSFLEGPCRSLAYKDDDYYAKGIIKVTYTSDEDFNLSPIDSFTYSSPYSNRRLCYYPDKVYEFLKTAEEKSILVGVVSACYEHKEETPVFINKDDYDQFSYEKDHEYIKDATIEKMFVTDLKMASLLNYLYNENALILEEEADLDDEQLEVLDNVLKDTRIYQSNISAVLEDGDIEQISRGRLVTLLFLDYFLTNEDRWYESLLSPAKRKRDFLVYMDHKLRKSRLYEYNISNPYEDVLLKFIVYDEPVEAFRDLWAKYLINKNKDKINNIN